ncbi:MAG: hypothetical protein ACKVJF_01495 [Flavobacteriales bacterium]
MEKKSNNNYTISFETADGSKGYEYGMSSIIFPDNDIMYYNYNDGMDGEESYREEYNRIE